MLFRSLLKNKLDHVLELLPSPSPEEDPDSEFIEIPGTTPDPTPTPTPTPMPTPTPPPHPGHTPYPPQGWWQYPGRPPYPPQYPGTYPRPAPPSYQVSSCQKSALQLAGQRERIQWNPECRLPWRLRGCSGHGICWDGRVPARIQLSPGRTYVVQYTLNVCAMCPAEGAGAICLRQTPCGAFTDAPLLRFSMERLSHGPQVLHHIAMLHPRINGGCAPELSLVLDAQAPLCVERAVMDIVEL